MVPTFMFSWPLVLKMDGTVKSKGQTVNQVKFVTKLPKIPLIMICVDLVSKLNCYLKKVVHAWASIQERKKKKEIDRSKNN